MSQSLLGILGMIESLMVSGERSRPLAVRETTYRKLLIPVVKTCSTTPSPGIAAAKGVPLKLTEVDLLTGLNLRLWCADWNAMLSMDLQTLTPCLCVCLYRKIMSSRRVPNDHSAANSETRTACHGEEVRLQEKRDRADLSPA